MDYNKNAGNGYGPRPQNNNRYENNSSKNTKSGWNKKDSSNQENEVEEFKRTHTFDSKWIKEDADAEMIKYTEEAGKILKDKGLTTSQIRNVYGEIKRIQGNVSRNQAAFYLLKPKMAYAVGRAKSNKRNVEAMEFFYYLFNNAISSINDLTDINYKNFSNFMEALIAYHKAFGGKEN